MQTLSNTYQPSAMVMTTTVGTELVMLDLDQDRYLSLNSTGRDVWVKLSEGLNGHEIARQISEDYGVDVSQVEQDVEHLLRDLLDRSMIEAAPSLPP